jgi:hypothetical protein
MKKYQVNFASTAKGAFGKFGNLLVTPLGHTEEADKVTIRTTEVVADKVASKLKELKGTGLVLTVSADFNEVTFADGTSGAREERWTNKAGEEVSQIAVYYRMATTPTWATEKGKDDEGNLADL